MVDYNKKYPGNTIDPSCYIHPNVQMGIGNRIGPFCIIGGHAEMRGNEQQGKVIIGDRNTITGLVTIDSGAEGNTRIFDDCYIMKHAHIGHDVKVVDNVTISCGANIGGHTILSSDSNIGLNAVIHQRQFIEEGCMIGMGAVITRTLVTQPFNIYAGNPAKLIGENTKHPKYESSRNTVRLSSARLHQSCERPESDKHRSRLHADHD